MFVFAFFMAISQDGVPFRSCVETIHVYVTMRVGCRTFWTTWGRRCSWLCLHAYFYDFFRDLRRQLHRSGILPEVLCAHEQ